jgi:sulfotransferase family protein
MNLVMARLKPSANRWGDKTPHHVCNILHIQKQYPEAQFIYTYSDPRNVVVSLSKRSFPNTTDSALLNAEVVRQYLSAYELQKKKAYQEAIYEVRYENLICDPEGEIRKICNFLRIEYMDEMLGEADDHIREIVGWPGDKAWSRITPQPARLPSRPNGYVDAYLRHWIVAHLGYDDKCTTYSHLRRVIVGFRLTPFLIARWALTLFWERKYPGFTFLMRRYPSIRAIARWLTRSLFPGRNT